MNKIKNYLRKIKQNLALYFISYIFTIIPIGVLSYVEYNTKIIETTLRVGLIDGKEVENLDKIITKITIVKQTNFVSPNNSMVISALKNNQESEITIKIKSLSEENALDRINLIINGLMKNHNDTVEQTRNKKITELKKTIQMKNIIHISLNSCIDNFLNDFSTKASCKMTGLEIINSINILENLNNKYNDLLGSLSANNLRETQVVKGIKIYNNNQLPLLLIRFILLSIIFSNVIFELILIIFKK